MVKKGVAASVAAMFALTLLGSTVLAQVATPVADCAATSPDENIQVVTDYLAAVTSGDAAGADALLHDDAIHDLSLEGAEVPNEPGNADELSEDNLAAAAEANLVVDTTVASDDWVAVEFSFDVSGEAVEGADPTLTAHVEAMAFARIECGMIAEAHFEFDALGLLQQLGYDLATPTP